MSIGFFRPSLSRAVFARRIRRHPYRRDRKCMLSVLPFKNLGPAYKEYFAEGISDGLGSRLAAVRKPGVISPVSAS